MIKSDSVDKNLKTIEKDIILAIKDKVNFSFGHYSVKWGKVELELGNFKEVVKRKKSYCIVYCIWNEGNNECRIEIDHEEKKLKIYNRFRYETIRYLINIVLKTLETDSEIVSEDDNYVWSIKSKKTSDMLWSIVYGIGI